MSILNKRRLIRTFLDLVRIDSHSHNEGKIINYLQKAMKRLGAKNRLAGKLEDGEVGNLISSLPGKKVKAPTVLLNAHVDTVHPGKKVKPRIKNGYIISDGKTVLGADNKAGVAAILEIVRILVENDLPHPPLQVVFTVAEEIGLKGAKALPTTSLKADFGLVFDGGSIETVINQAPAQIGLVAIIHGRAAHAGVHPERGINAIKVASQAIAKMRLGRIDHETTANIGLISGGRATNIIPDKVEVKGEARSHDPRKLKRQVRHMVERFKKACRTAKARLEVKLEKTYPSFVIHKNHRLIHLATKAIKRAGLKPTVRRTGGGSDANIFNQAGVPCIIVGVGAENIHTTRERIKVDDLVKGTDIILQIIRGIA